MKRHPTLQRLSRDHQLALAVALELTRAVEASAPAARTRFLNFWRAEDGSTFAKKRRSCCRRSRGEAILATRSLRACSPTMSSCEATPPSSRRMRIHHPQYFAGSATSEGRLNRYEKQP
jgi:hypothetical protein